MPVARRRGVNGRRDQCCRLEKFEETHKVTFLPFPIILCDCPYCSLSKEEASLDCAAGSFFFFKLRDTALQKLNWGQARKWWEKGKGRWQFFSLSSLPAPPSFSLFDLVCGREPKTKVRQILQSIVVASYFDKKGEVCYSFCAFYTCAKVIIFYC